MVGNHLPVVGNPKLNLGSGGDVRPKSDGWVNMDGYYDHPDVVKHDITKVPYPFPDHFFEAVYASHVMEHIPLVFREWNGTQRDVLYDVIEEVHRILKPGGRFHVAVPLGGTDIGMINPQHYRQWRIEWFRYFDRRHGETALYHDADFRLEKLRLNRAGVRARYFMRVGPSGLGVFEHLVTRFPRATSWLLQPRGEIEAILIAEP